MELNICSEFYLIRTCCIFSQFDDGFENLGGAATPPRHTNVPKSGHCEHLHSTNATQSSKSINVEYNIQHRQNTPQDPSSSNDYGGMTRIIPSDVNVSPVFSKFIFENFSCIIKFK